MTDLKTKQTEANPEVFLNQIEDEKKRQDAYAILRIMQKITRAEPKMWGSSIIGFGKYHYTYATGRTGDWFLTGFSPRKQNLTLYIMAGFDNYEALLGKLGKYKTGKSCLYIKKLEDVNLSVLEELIAQSVAHMQKTDL
jgi:hypothetical protein